jgi:hypothetical protein
VKRAILLLVLAGCATVSPSLRRAPHIDCRALKCPSELELERALDAFHAVAPDFDPRLPLTVEWHAADEVLRRNDHGAVISDAPSGIYVRVVSWSTLAHELMHVRYWRLHRDPDYNHAAPPGPWTHADDATIEVVKVTMQGGT